MAALAGSPWACDKRNAANRANKVPGNRGRVAANMRGEIICCGAPHLGVVRNYRLVINRYVGKRDACEKAKRHLLFTLSTSFVCRMAGCFLLN